MLAFALMAALAVAGPLQLSAVEEAAAVQRTVNHPYQVRQIVVDNTGDQVGATVHHRGADWTGSVEIRFDVKGGPRPELVAVISRGGTKKHRFSRADGTRWRCEGRVAHSDRSGAVTHVAAPRSCFLKAPKLRVGVKVTADIGSGDAAQSPVVKRQPQPNVVMIMVDDMREDEIAWMPHTRQLLTQFELTDFVSNHPLCCPARAEFLTGQFGHNNGVHHNVGPNGGYPSMKDPHDTVASWFDAAGYHTSLVGKFMNGWTARLGKPGGWDRFSVLTRGTYSAYDFDVWHEDGTTSTYTDLHNNDFVTEATVARLNEADRLEVPAFHFASYTAPHTYRVNGEWVPPIPADRHQGLFDNVRPPSESKPSYAPTKGMEIVEAFQQRIRSLQSVDEGVRDIVQATKDNGTYASTIFVFTSDNGYMLGEHSLYGKNVPYEEVLQVPFLAAGPGVPTGSSDKGSMMVDLASSLAHLVGITPTRPQDGRADLFSLDGGWQQLLIQGGHDTEPWWWRGVREDKWVYVRYVDRAPELYDLANDPHQTNNLAGTKPRLEERLRTSFVEVDGMERTEPQAPARVLTKPNG